MSISPPLPPPPGSTSWNASGAPDIPPPGPTPEGSDAPWNIPEPGTMGVGNVVDAGVRLWLGMWGRLALLSLILSGAAIVAAAAAGSVSVADAIRWLQDGADPSQIPKASPLANSLVQGHNWLLTPMLLVALARAVLGAAAGAGPTLGRTLHVSLIRLPQSLWLLIAEAILFIGLSIGAGIVIVIGAVAGDLAGLAITGIPVFVVLFAVFMRLSLATSALVLEDYRGFKALGYAWRLTSGKTWKTVAVLLLAGIIAFGGAVVGLLIEFLVPGSGAGSDVVRATVQAATTAAVGPLGTCIAAVLYLDLLARSRGGLRTGEVRRWLESHDPS